MGFVNPFFVRRGSEPKVTSSATAREGDRFVRTKSLRRVGREEAIRPMADSTLE